MPELFAGYVLQAVKNQIAKSDQRDFWTEISAKLSAFYCKNSILNNAGNESEHPIFSVLDNQLSRGLPTLPSIHIERRFAEILGLTRESIYNGAISFEAVNIGPQHLRCLILADPRNTASNSEVAFQTWEAHGGSDVEQVFFQSVINDFGPCANQLLQLQRSITSVVGTYGGEDLFVQQTMDFLLEFPKSSGFPNGLIIEIDGRQHNEEPQRSRDARRDQYASENGYQVLRIKASDVHNIPPAARNRIVSYLAHPYSARFFRNIQEPLFSIKRGIDYLQLLLSPYGIARVQKVLIKAIKKGLLDLSKDSLRIAIIERDIPCGQLAVEDLKLQIEHLSILQRGAPPLLPDLDVHIFNTAEFSKCQINTSAKTSLYSDDIDFSSFDLTIDVSVLSYSTFLNRPTHSSPNKTVVVRSVHHSEQQRKFSFHPPITYGNMSEASVISLTFFLQSLFRKEAFREGQLPILSKALRQKNPIALLPTGAGKSLTYQLASLLQAGLTVVVDPIKALMRDQHQGLKLASIDATVFINASQSAQEREEATRRFTEGEALFAFVSPERFVIQRFRDAIGGIHAFRRNFVYCVIDEAHCVSEWGHDFRTPYLRLGENARKFCPTGNGNPVPLLGLTGTASFDVLSDVQREVGLPVDEEPVRPEKSERKELKFRIREVEALLVGARNDWNIRTSVAAATRADLLNVLNNDLAREFDAESFIDFIRQNGPDTNCGLIFCPYATGQDLSVQSVAEFLRNSFPAAAHLIGEFYGANSINNAVQDAFKNNEITLLVATKAFGMGIDKPNVRFTVHLTHPISIEGFYQEAGRAGRDKTPALCYILHCRNLRLSNGNTVAKSIQESFLFNSFKGRTYEKNITAEMLERITFPQLQTKNVLEERIAAEFGYEVRLSLFPQDGPHTLYVNGAEKGTDYGRLSIPALGVGGLGTALPMDEAANFLNRLSAWLAAEKPAAENVVNWLRAPVAKHEKPGIETFLQTLGPNEIRPLIIGLQNDGVNRVVEYLRTDYPSTSSEIVVKATIFCKTAAEFAGKLGRALNNVVFTNEEIATLKDLYTRIRFNSDTLKAIHRLTILGVVDDYTIDYLSDSVIMQCRKLSDEQILRRLGEYVGHYKGENTVQAAIADAQARPQATTLRKCLDYVIDFAYDQIFSKRQNALLNIENAVNQANDRLFTLEVNDYFDSPYRDALYKATGEGRESDTDVLFSYIAEAGDDKNKLQQLRASALRLTEVNPDNGLFYWLAYYCSVLLKDRESSVVQHYFDTGFQKFYNNGIGLSYAKIDALTAHIGEQINLHDGVSHRLHQEHMTALGAELTNAAVKTFTQRFLLDYVQ